MHYRLVYEWFRANSPEKISTEGLAFELRQKNVGRVSWTPPDNELYEEQNHHLHMSPWSQKRLIFTPKPEKSFYDIHKHDYETELLNIRLNL